MPAAPERACRVFDYVRPVYDFHPKPQAYLVFLEQALEIFPWLEEVFQRYPRVGWVKQLWKSILTGASFKQSLSRELGVETRHVGRFHRLPTSWVGRLYLMDYSENGSPLKAALSVAARSLPFIEKSLYPTAPSDCQLMLDAWRFAPLTNDSLRGYVAASIYTQMRVANSASLLTKLDEWPQILLVKQQLAKLIPASDTPLDATRRVRASASLSEFVLAFLLCERRLDYVLRFSEEVSKQLGSVLAAQDNIELPYLDIVHAHEGRRHGQQARGLYVTPIRSTHEMMQQAMELNNCMNTLVLDALLAEFSPFMAIRNQQGRLLAHLEIGYVNCEYTQRQLLGKNNSDPPHGCKQLVEELLCTLNESGLTPVERVTKAFNPSAIPRNLHMTDLIRLANHYWRLQ